MRLLASPQSLNCNVHVGIKFFPPQNILVEIQKEPASNTEVPTSNMSPPAWFQNR